MNLTTTPGSPPSHPIRSQLGVLWRILSLPMLMFLALPLLALFIEASPTRFFANLTNPQVVEALGVSMYTTLMATMTVVIAGTPLAYLLANRSLRLKRWVDTLIDLPTVLPPAVAGVALLLTFGRRGLLGSALDIFGLQIAFTPLAVILAQVFISAPFYIKAATLGFSSIDHEIEQAAALDGAGTFQIFRYILVPLSWQALLSGSVMSWARALGEFGATIIFAGNFPGRTQTMPLAIYIGFEINLDVALTLSIILILASFLVLMLVKGFLQREIT